MIEWSLSRLERVSPFFVKKKDGKIRLDATITYRDDSHEVGVYAHDDVSYQHGKSCT